MKHPRPIVECSECPDYYDGGMISYPTPQCTHDSFCNTRYPPIVIDEGKLFPSFCPLEDAPTDAFVCSRCGVEYDPLEDAVNPVNDLATDARIDALLKEPNP